MTAGAYVLDVLLLAVVVCSAALVGWSVRRGVLPSWSGAPARLVECIAGIAALILIGELLGAVDAFRRATLIAAAVCAAVGSLVISSHYRSAVPPLPSPPRSGRMPVALAAVTVAIVVSRSLQSALDAFHAGMGSYDTLWYHLPFAARFVQDGSLLHLQYVGNGPTTFYPANGELVHAVGMLLFRGDLLSPVVNIGWFALAMLAGWCVGRPYGVAPATLVATCLVTFLPAMGAAQAGSAGTDVAVVALLVSAVAVLVNGPHSTAALGVASLAAGLAAGTKLDAWAPALALGAVAVTVRRGHRVGTALRWVIGVASTSGFWYIRNLIAVGNPFPWFGRFVSLPTTTAPTDCGSTSVAHYLGDGGFWSSHLLPQLPTALGARWWLVVGLAVAGVGAGLISTRPRARGLALV